ncbi:MAG TPA: CatB-related O-acetyltransferase [Acidimicrobiales bacterium]|nr:CatB-related O-acetyltransferase [Acidimicrobiales bacterium]
MRKVRFWTFGQDVIFWQDSRQRVVLQGPSWPTFKVVQGPTDVDPQPVTIGRYSGLHPTVTIIPGSEHDPGWVSILHAHVEDGQWVRGEEEFVGRGPVVIGNDVWVGYEALILSGVTVGDGAIIAARALVRKPVQPFEIVGGNPAKTIGWRFDEPTREALLRIRWWDWSDEKVAAHKDQIQSSDAAGFVSRHDPALGAPTCPLCA